jgi:hypothetical protein
MATTYGGSAQRASSTTSSAGRSHRSTRGGGDLFSHVVLPGVTMEYVFDPRVAPLLRMFVCNVTILMHGRALSAGGLP